MTSVYYDHSDAWVSELKQLVEAPQTVAPRGMPIREHEFVTFIVQHPLSFPLVAQGREFKNVIGVLEGLSLVGQVGVTELFTDRVRKFHDFTDDGVFHGAYGARVHGQIGDLVRTLQRDPDSRQGVVTIFDATRDLDRPKKDIPCTVAIQFLLRDNHLKMGVTMRSNDIWLGTPYDLIQFSILQASVAQAVGVEPGYYQHSVGSLHLYERNWGDAANIGAASVLVPEFAFPLWNAKGLEEIVERARRILLGHPQVGMTEFEGWAWSLLHK